MLIPHDKLSAQALRSLIEEFITREGTDYGSIVYTLDDKVDQVQQQLDSGEVLVVFDAGENSCTLLHRNQAEQLPQD